VVNGGLGSDKIGGIGWEEGVRTVGINREERRETESESSTDVLGYDSFHVWGWMGSIEERRQT
jgi:hypothetical protein